MLWLLLFVGGGVGGVVVVLVVLVVAGVVHVVVWCRCCYNSFVNYLLSYLVCQLVISLLLGSSVVSLSLFVRVLWLSLFVPLCIGYIVSLRPFLCAAVTFYLSNTRRGSSLCVFVLFVLFFVLLLP